MIIQSSWLDLGKIAQSGQTFLWQNMPATTKNGSDSPPTYVIPAMGRVLTARQLAQDKVELDCATGEWEDIWSQYFDIDNDYNTIAALIDPSDNYLIKACQAACGLRMLHQDLWETTVSFICSQNNNIPRITGILRRICITCGCFPTAEQLICESREALQSCGLGYRLDYLLRAAERFIAEQPERFITRYNYEQARKYLMTYHGIGPKVADCICLYGLGHTGAFPRDVWVKRIEQLYYNGEFPVKRYYKVAGILQLFMFWYERTKP